MSKISEGERFLQEAEKSLKTSMFKWKPDYDSAACDFEKAAASFKAAKAFERALSCFLKASNSYIESKQFFAAAKTYEQAGIILYKELNKEKEAFDLIEKACIYFRENGTPDTAALAYDRAAKMIENKHPEIAAKYYWQASDTSLIEDRIQQSCEYACKCAKLYVKMKKISEALDILKKTILIQQSNGEKNTCEKLIIFTVLLHLHQEDTVSANRVFQDGKNYLSNDSYNILSKLIDGFDNWNSKTIVNTLDHPFIRNLDTEYSIIARSIKEIHEAKIKSANNASEKNDYDSEEGVLL